MMEQTIEIEFNDASNSSDETPPTLVKEKYPANDFEGIEIPLTNPCDEVMQDTRTTKKFLKAFLAQFKPKPLTYTYSDEELKELKRKKNCEHQRAYYYRQKNLKKNEIKIKKEKKKVPKSNAERQREFRRRNAEKSSVKICKQCPETFTSTKFLQNHNESSHGIIYPQCDHCKLKFKDRKSIENHMIKIHTNINRIVCPGCDLKGFPSKRLLNLHINEFHPDLSKAVACPICARISKTPSHLRQHYREVHNPERYACDMCERSFKNERTLKKHKEVNHTDKPVLYECEICSKNFTMLTYKNKHKRLKHCANENLQCTLCPKTFRNNFYLKKHYENSHTDRKVSCIICGKELSSRVHLKNHVKIMHHLIEAEFECDVCANKFKTEQRLKQHQDRMHSDKRFVEGAEVPCTICAKIYPTATHLRYHMRNVHSDTQRIDCPICENKSLSNKRYFRKHMWRVHKVRSGDNMCKSDLGITTPAKAIKQTNEGNSCEVVVEIEPVVHLEEPQPTVMITEIKVEPVEEELSTDIPMEYDISVVKNEPKSMD